jgi:hypothetical protein
MRRGVIKAVLALGAIAAVGAGLALTGAGAAPPSGPQGPTITLQAPVTPSVFRHSVHTLPQVGLSKQERPRPRKWERDDLVPVAPKTELPGALEPQQAATLPSGPAAAPSASFAGLDSATWGAGWPPDTNGDVGPAHFIQAVNTSIGIFRKSDGVRLAAFTFDSLWANADTGTACDNDNQGDPTVVYDPIGDRWIVADFGMASFTTPPFYECIAVSRTGDPVNGGWYFYAVRADDAAHPWFPDYPKMGIWPDGLYMTANMFQGNTYREVRGWAFNRADLESGAPLRSVVMDTNTSSYFSMLPSNMRTAAGAPPAGSPNYFVAESQTQFAFQVWKFHVDYSGSGSTFTGPTNVSQASYNTGGGNVPSPGNPLDSLYDRLMNQAQYSNIGGNESVWVNHTVRCCGTGSPMGQQWAQIRVTGGTVSTTPVQQQIYPGSNDGLHRWMGSVAVDKLGDLALGYSVSSSTVNPDIRYAGRLAGDPLGTLPLTETTMLPGITRGTQLGNCGGGTCTRWGDYSAMVLDPNGCDFWFTTEYYAATGMNWQTRIGSFRLNPNCAGGGGGGSQSQTITFGALADKTFGDPDFTVTATASSGLPVSFSAADNCTVSGNVVHLTGAGSCAITASQAGDATYAPAPDVSRTFTIARASQTISFGPLPDKTFGDPDFTVSATASSGLPVSFAATGNCTVSGSTVHLTAAGSCTITASQGGNANYSAAPSVPHSFTINPGSGSTPLSISSSLEGTLSFSSGAWVNGGWHVKLSTSNSSPVTVTVTGNVSLPVTCPSGGGAGGTVTVPVSKTVTIPAGSTSYVPTNDTKSVLGWMGAEQAPALCGANAMRNTSATFDVTVQSSSHAGQLAFQFHYRVPAANSRQNTNCTVSGGNACRAQWSSTGTV